MEYQVVGSCQVHGLSDAESLLGLLPEGWEFKVRQGAMGQRVHYFHNTVTGEDSADDPRLDELPLGWESFEGENTDTEADRVSWFRREVTGETTSVNSDPRLCERPLKDRGVDVQTIRLV